MVTKLLSHGPVATGKDAKNAPSASGVAVIFSKLLMLSRSFRCLASRRSRLCCTLSWAKSAL